MFERPITFQHGDGTTSAGRIDCYRRGHFVLEAKKLKAASHTKGFDDGLLRARSQAEAYARALPASEGRPPFVLVVDVGTVIEVYAEFSRSGATYTPFPDPRSHRIALADLAQPEVRARLRAIWTAPHSLDPARRSAQVTREVAALLARLAKTLEQRHPPEQVATFLTRCLFSMFAEDVGLLPPLVWSASSAAVLGEAQDPGNGEPPGYPGAFSALLKVHRNRPDVLQRMLRILWADMDMGGFSAALASDVLRFNGKLFKGAGADGYSLLLQPDKSTLLIQAAQANWREVEPAIFGTLLERALDPTERHALGAHYTPRAYVERLVLPTVINPARRMGQRPGRRLVLAQEAAELDLTPAARCWRRQAKLGQEEEARAESSANTCQPWTPCTTTSKLCTTPVHVRVLDPACGSGNFLVRDAGAPQAPGGRGDQPARSPGPDAGAPGPGGRNRHAAAAARHRSSTSAPPRWPSWCCGSAGCSGTSAPAAWPAWPSPWCTTTATSNAATPCWPGTAGAGHDERARSHPLGRHHLQKPPGDRRGRARRGRAGAAVALRQPAPRRVAAGGFHCGEPAVHWRRAMRAALGDGYVQACAPPGPTCRRARTSSCTGGTTRPPGARWAGATHWVHHHQQPAADLQPAGGAGGTGDFGEVVVALGEKTGVLHADLSIGANTAGSGPLRANENMSNRGVQLFGAGFIVTPAEAQGLGFGNTPGIDCIIRSYRNGRDLTEEPRGVMVLDAFGLSAEQLRSQFPAIYQWLLERVKPERDLNNRPSRRDNWWLFGETNPKLRKQLKGLPRYIATVETAKHRTFQFVETSILPDNMLVAIASDEAFLLGVLSSQCHAEWAWANGGSLGMYIGNVRYNKSRCFETFPFPDQDTGLTPELRNYIANLAEQIDALRKRVLTPPRSPETGQTGAVGSDLAREARMSDPQPPSAPLPAAKNKDRLTLTGLYNVLEALREGRELTPKEKQIHTHGLVGVLKDLHDELDAAVLQAYGWNDLNAGAPDTPELLERLVALNARRAAEEKAGTVRWLRPEFQNPAAPLAQKALQNQELPVEKLQGLQADLALNTPVEEVQPTKPRKGTGAAVLAKVQAWPATLPEQVRAVAAVLAGANAPLSLDALEASFTSRGAWKKSLPRILETLEALGRAQRVRDGWGA
jgi:hypothetical protein